MANALLLPTDYRGPQVDIAGNIMRGQQVTAMRNENALAPMKQQNLEQQNQMNAMNIDRAKQQVVLDQAKLQAEGHKLLLGPSKYIVSVYEKDPALAQELYKKLVPTAQQFGIDATPEYDHEAMKMFVSGVEKEAGGEVLTTPQLYSNPKTGRDEMWFFDKTGKPAQFVRKASAQDISGEGGKDAFNKEDKLRNEFTNLTKPFREVRDAYGRIKEAAKAPSAAGDLALIFNYMKMLDPGSVVREGEFATAQNAAGVPDRIRAMYNKVTEGERLADNTRADFVERSEMLYKTADNQHKQARKEYGRLAKEAGLKESIFPDLSVAGIEEKPAAKPLTATNPKTGEKIKSIDGGKTWIKADAGTMQLAQVTAQDVPLGSGMANQAKSLIQLRKELNQAYMNGDDAKAQEIERQIQQITAQQKNVG